MGYPTRPGPPSDLNTHLDIILEPHQACRAVDLGMYTFWYAAVSYPVTSGTLGVLAVTFQVCNITQGSLEVYNDEGNVVRVLSDPAWATVLKALALALSTTAWMAMFLAMALQRNTARSLTLAALAWTSAAVLLLCMIGILSPRQQPQSNTRFTQGFVYGVFASGICAIIAALLFAYVGTASKLHLTDAHKPVLEDTTLMLRAMVFHIHLLLGAVIYSAVEGWSFLDSLYFADYTLLTVGIGNLVPKTHLGRSLLFPYATTGIMFLGLTVTALQSFVTSQRHVKLYLRRTSAWQSCLSKHHHTHPPQLVMAPRGGGGGGPPDQHQEEEEEEEEEGEEETFFLPHEEDFQDLQTLQAKYARRNRWHIFISSALTLFFLWFISAAIFRRSERRHGWSYFDALYFTFTSLTTIGYGDFYPMSNFSTAFFVFWSLLAVPVLTFLIGAMGDTFLRAVKGYAARILYWDRLPVRRLGRRLTDARGATRQDDPETHMRMHMHLTRSPPRRRGPTGDGDEGRVSIVDHCKRDPNVYLWVLAEEVHDLARTLRMNPQRQYSFRKWIEVFALLNHRLTGGTRTGGVQMGSVGGGVQVPGHSDGGLERENPILSGANESLWMLERVARKLAGDLEERVDGRIVRDWSPRYRLPTPPPPPTTTFTPSTPTPT